MDFSLGHNDYEKELKARDALADQVTGEVGYGKAREFGNKQLRDMLKARAARMNNPVEYGASKMASFQDAINEVNPDLYNKYYDVANKSNKRALESANKRVGEAKEVEKMNHSMVSSLGQAAGSLVSTGAHMYGLASGNKPTLTSGPISGQMLKPFTSMGEKMHDLASGKKPTLTFQQKQ